MICVSPAEKAQLNALAQREDLSLGRLVVKALGIVDRPGLKRAEVVRKPQKYYKTTKEDPELEREALRISYAEGITMHEARKRAAERTENARQQEDADGG